MQATETERAPLPSLIAGHLERNVPDEAMLHDRVSLKQIGQMWLKPGASPMAFEGSQWISAREVAFSWDAVFRPFPLFRISVVDAFVEGRGLLTAKLWGRVPFVKAEGSQTDLAQALRYLAELPWVPHAMRRNKGLTLTQLDDRHVEASTPVGNARASLQLEFSSDGDIAGARADRRPRMVGKTTTMTPWGGRFWDYQQRGPLRIPTRGEVWWELDGRRDVYWRGQITELTC